MPARQGLANLPEHLDQMTKRAKELKIDIEAILLSNQAKVTGAAATAPKLASVLSWITTNTSHVGTDPTGDGTDARVDGTPRAFTEAMLKTVMASVYANSSDDLDVLMVGAANKAVASGFAGGAQKTYDVSERRLVTTIDVYVGDFSTVRIIPNRFMRSRDALLLNWSHWSVDWLRPIRQIELAKTGDAEKRLLIGEYTLRANNEKGSGLIADLTTP